MRKAKVLIFATRHVGDWTSGADRRLLKGLEPLLKEYDFGLFHRSELNSEIPNKFKIELKGYFSSNIFTFDALTFDPRKYIRFPGPMVYLPGSRKWQDALIKAVHSFKPDIIQTELLQASYYLPLSLRGKALAFGQDSYARFSKTRAIESNNLFNKLIFYIDSLAYSFAERCYLKYPHSVFLSEADTKAIASQARTSVLHLGVKTGNVDLLPKTKIIGFGGNLSYLPNVDGIVDFVQSHWQSITDEEPNVRLLIAGRSPDPRIVNVSNKHPNVDLVVNPDDLSEVMRKARLIICPVHWGSGQKYKILEALAIARPVLCSEHMIEGTPLKNEEHLFASKSNSDWSIKILKIIKDTESLERVRRSGFDFVRENYSWEKFSSPLSQIYQQVMNGRSNNETD